MDALEIIQYIRDSKKQTPVKVYLNTTKKIEFKNAKVFGSETSFTVFANWEDIKETLEENKEYIIDKIIENTARNQGVPLLDMLNINARIEPGAIIREKVEIGNNAIILMGATINIGAVIGDNSMIDMGAILGGRAMVGKNCHIGAGAVLAGVVEPASALPVVVEDNVLIGANAVVLEGIRIGKGAVVAAGAIVTTDVLPGSVVAGAPAKHIKYVDGKTTSKTGLVEDLRKL